MSDNSKIEWTDKTWNPVRGCSRVSPGCEHCYAERQAHRFSGPGGKYDGLTRLTKHGPVWTGRIQLVPEKLSEHLRWKKPCRIFVNSMSDLFHEGVPDEFIDQVFAVMALCPQHTFQLLTKRAERMRSYFLQPETPHRIGHHRAVLAGMSELDLAEDGPAIPVALPLKNLWLGVSVEDQQRADERIPELLRTPAAVRFLSVEPMLSAVDLTEIELPADLALSRTVPAHINCLTDHDDDHFFNAHARISLVICGGESGPSARPCNVQWIRSIVQQCKAAGVACFVKQLGSAPISIVDHISHRGDTTPKPNGFYRFLNDRKGGDMAEFPEDLRVRVLPESLERNGQNHTQ